MKGYKLTDEKGQTLNQTQWGPGITHQTNGKGELCGPGWLHYYSHPVLGILLNPIHANFSNPRMWKCEAGGSIKNDLGLKFGCTHLTTLEEISPPKISYRQRILFGMNAVIATDLASEDFVVWAKQWVAGGDVSHLTVELAYKRAGDFRFSAFARVEELIVRAILLEDVYYATRAVDLVTRRRYLSSPNEDKLLNLFESIRNV